MVEADRDPLVERREHAHAQLAVEGGLADQEPSERGRGVHLRVRQEPQLLELVGVQEMGLIQMSTTRRCRSAVSAASKSPACAMSSA